MQYHPTSPFKSLQADFSYIEGFLDGEESEGVMREVQAALRSVFDSQDETESILHLNRALKLGGLSLYVDVNPMDSSSWRINLLSTLCDTAIVQALEALLALVSATGSRRLKLCAQESCRYRFIDCTNGNRREFCKSHASLARRARSGRK